MAYIVMAYIVMTYIAMTCKLWPTQLWPIRCGLQKWRPAEVMACISYEVHKLWPAQVEPCKVMARKIMTYWSLQSRMLYVSKIYSRSLGAAVAPAQSSRSLRHATLLHLQTKRLKAGGLEKGSRPPTSKTRFEP